MAYLIGVIILLMLALVAGGWYFSEAVIHPKTRTPEESLAYHLENGWLDSAAWAAAPRESVEIVSPHGYGLYGVYIPVPDSTRTVIIAHGITANLIHSIKYLWSFRSRGFNVLLIEHRNHGRSGGHDTTFGYWEKDDMVAWVDWAASRCGQADAVSLDDCIVGIHGESMGAVIALETAAVDPRVAFVVADCPFAEAAEEFAYRLKEDYRLPAFPLVPLASVITRLRTGFAFDRVAPLVHMPALETPVLFVHGAADTYIPPEASERLYEAKRGARKLWLAPGADHAEAYLKHPEAYDRLIGEFLADIGIA